MCEYLAACAHDPMPSLDALRAAASSAAAHAAAAAGGALGEMELMSDCQEIAADDTQLLLQDAFSSLSLHEKCALSMSLKGPGRAQTAHGLAAAGGVLLGADEGDASSVITESDKESLDVAMSLMEPSELGELEEEARVIQSNVKAWIMRRNYKRMREAVNTLEDRWLERRASLARQAAIPALKSEAMAAHLPEGGVLYGEQEEWLANKLQAASRGMIARRQLQRIKSQTLALLVIQKNLKGRVRFRAPGTPDLPARSPPQALPRTL